MKNFILTVSVATAALFTTPAFTFAADKPVGEHPKRPGGPGGPGGEHGPGDRLKMMTEKLGLTADQQDKIKAIFEKNGPKIKELMAKGRENLTEDDKAKMGELMKAQHEEIAAVLTDEQKEKMKKLREQHPGGPGGPGGDHKRGDHKPGDHKPGDHKPGDAKPEPVPPAAVQ